MSLIFFWPALFTILCAESSSVVPQKAPSSYEEPPMRSPAPCPTKCVAGPMVEGKLGYFFFVDGKLQKIYNGGGVDVQLSGSYPIWSWLQLYGSVEYLQCSGRSLHGHQRTTLFEVPINIGLRPVVTITPTAYYYFALGPRYFYVHQHNSSSYVPRNHGRSGIGLFVNTGFYFVHCCGLLLDLFGEYSYAPTHFASKGYAYGRHIQVGGFTFGIGAGYAF